MATYEVTDPQTGRKVRLTGNSPPTEQELAQVFASLSTGPAKEKRFVGPTQDQAGIPRLNDNMNSPLDAGIAAVDLAISGGRALVNKPTLTAQSLMHGAFGAVNPNDTFSDAFWRSQQFGREEIEAGRGIVASEHLRTPQGEIAAEAIGNLPGIRHVGQAINWAGQKVEDVAGPEVRDIVESVVTLGTLGRAPTALNAARRGPLTAESVVARSTDGGSAGAAAAATDISAISPELRSAIVSEGGRSNRVSPEVLNRHVEADTLPVPIRLTEGEATQDAVQLSRERNLRGKHTEVVRRMEETNQALGQNLQAVRDEVGQNVFSTNMVEHGDALISAYRAQDAAAERSVSVAYHRLREAAGGSIPVDARAVLDRATASLHQRLLFDHAPPEIMRTLTRLAENNSMTFENFESLRTNLARIQRSGADGNVKAAAGAIRQELEHLPLTAGSEHLKTLADAARATARRRFEALEADPAYAAAVNDSVPADRFVQKFVIGAPRDDVDVMMRNLGNDSSARQTVSVAVLDHLREAARLDRNYTGNFSATGFDKALQGLDPKANIIFDATTAETLGKLRNVARYTTFQPRGSFINNSNTLVAGAAKYGADVAEGMTNFMAFGAPVGTVARRGLEALGTRRAINRALRPGAGLRDSNALRYADRE